MKNILKAVLILVCTLQLVSCGKDEDGNPINPGEGFYEVTGFTGSGIPSSTNPALTNEQLINGIGNFGLMGQFQIQIASTGFASYFGDNCSLNLTDTFYDFTAQTIDGGRGDGTILVFPADIVDGKIMTFYERYENPDGSVFIIRMERIQNPCPTFIACTEQPVQDLTGSNFTVTNGTSNVAAGSLVIQEQGGNGILEGYYEALDGSRYDFINDFSNDNSEGSFYDNSEGSLQIIASNNSSNFKFNGQLQLCDSRQENVFEGFIQTNGGESFSFTATAQ